MKTTCLYAIIALFFIPLGSLAQGIESSADSEKPNVLFIICDDLDCRLSCYGDPVALTPNFDRLAGMGVKFDRAYCQSPACNPSRASVLSGRYPEATGVLDNATVLLLKEEQEMLPEYFANRGYDTTLYGKIFHGPNVGFLEGEVPDLKKKWVTPEERAIQQQENPDFWEEHSVAYRNMVTKNPSSHPGKFGPWEKPVKDKKNDSVSADWAIQSLREFSEGEKPFFLAVGFRKPHVPMIAPQRYFDLYTPDEMQLPLDFNTEPAKIPGFPEAEFRENIDLFAARSFTRSEARDAMEAYYACASYIDDQLGRILDELENLDLAKNTIIVLWGDHGWHLSEKGIWAKGTLFEVSARAPMIIVDPRIKTAGQTSPRTVQFIDIFPTLTDLCGLPHNGFTQGRSLRPLLENPEKEWPYPAYTVQTRLWSIGRSVRTEDWRYTEWEGTLQGSALFDHRSDTRETINLVANPGYSQIVEEMKQMLDLARAEVENEGHPTSQHHYLEGDDLNLYFNQETSALMIDGLESESLLQIIDIDGKVRYSGSLENQPHINVNISDLSSGLYVAAIRKESGFVAKKFVKP